MFLEKNVHYFDCNIHLLNNAVNLTWPLTANSVNKRLFLKILVPSDNLLLN